jgi:KaiC/GvpD/RAD55 family RecA-like ATPase
MERVKSGIAGLDQLLGGGFPKKSTTLLWGASGTGKTILAMQFLHEGATKFEESGVYVSLSEDPKQLTERMESDFSWDFDALIKEKSFLMAKTEIYNFEHLMSSIEDMVHQVSAKRVVIDPVSILAMYFEKPLDMRKSMVDLDSLLKKLGCTSLLTCDILDKTERSAQESVCDNILKVEYQEEGGDLLSRVISVTKMRTASFDSEPHPFEINKKGITVYPEDDVF